MNLFVRDVYSASAKATRGTMPGVDKSCREVLTPRCVYIGLLPMLLVKYSVVYRITCTCFEVSIVRYDELTTPVSKHGPCRFCTKEFITFRRVFETSWKRGMCLVNI